ncbi:MAG TPA: PH domain-containing protein [Candidatus Saccharimonadales bacterium]|nr:PH domain-containing protein [Candidatus Saccharimonadales bacterium]
MDPQNPQSNQTPNWQAPNTPPAPLPPYQPAPPSSATNWQQPVDTGGLPPVMPSPYQPMPPTAPAPSANAPASPSMPSVLNAEDDMHKPRFRNLNLSPGEKVLSEMHRHPIGILQIYATATLVMLGLLVAAGALIRYAAHPQADVISGAALHIPVGAILGIAGVLAFLVLLISAIAIRVYHGNRLYLTNESVIQKVQNSLFDTKEQQITLGNIEDVSYEQTGVMQHMFNYGTLRLSTEGQETTYYFYYATDPKNQAGQIINAQEEFNRLHPAHHY